jgi:hypothetical protein
LTNEFIYQQRTSLLPLGKIKDKKVLKGLSLFDHPLLPVSISILKRKKLLAPRHSEE